MAEKMKKFKDADRGEPFDLLADLPMSLIPCTASPDCDESLIQNTLTDIETALTSCEEVPEAGEDFACSVQEKLIDIRDTIVRTNRVTDAQIQAISNMQSGIDRWVNS